jgi:phosphoribosylanthranilate isomerase
MALWIKVCGITRFEDAFVALDAGADALGVNFVSSSKRHVDVEFGRALCEAVGDRAEIIAVVADRSLAELAEIRERTGVAWLQLHGSEAPDAVRALLPHAYKAVRIATASDANEAQRMPGERLLADAKVEGELGGTGKVFDWRLVVELSRERKLVLAGGLTPENVAEAIRITRPFGVDVASGVEAGDPRKKDPERVARFVRAVRSADEAR